MKKRIIGRILQAPALLILVAGALAVLILKINPSLQAKYGVQDNGLLGSFILFVILLVLYFWGRVLEAKSYAHQVHITHHN